MTSFVVSTMLLPLILALVQAPTLDGTIAPGEWDRATRQAGSSRLEVFLLSTDSAWYVAVRGTGDGYPHIALARGDTVLILHASAALGTGRFAGPGAEKRRTKPFDDFRVRDPGFSASAVAARERFYREEGWVATTIRMGRPGETEFKIDRKLVDGNRGMVVAYWVEGAGVSHWPAAVDDASVTERMVQGWLPETARFQISGWGRP